MKRTVRWVLTTMAAVILLLALGYGALVATTWRGFSRESCRITPFMYHAVVSDTQAAARYWLRESQFSRQMDQLRAAGAVTPPLDSIVAWLGRPDEPCPFPPNAVVITFDLDGGSDHVRQALPHLERNGFRAVFFVPLGSLDHGEGVTTQGVAALAGAGMTIGSHSEHHYDMRLEQPDTMVASLLRTRRHLGALTGQPIASVSAPGGRYDAQVVAGVERAGFSSFFTSDPCYITPAFSPLTLCRIEIRGDGGMTALEATQHPWGVAVQASNWAVKRRVEAIVGRRFWRYLNTLRKAWDGPGY